MPEVELRPRWHLDPDRRMLLHTRCIPIRLACSARMTIRTGA